MYSFLDLDFFLKEGFDKQGFNETRTLINKCYIFQFSIPFLHIFCQNILSQNSSQANAQTIYLRLSKTLKSKFKSG